MSSVKLTATQNLILTTIAWRGPCTPYELKDYFQRIVRMLVDVPHTLLYTEPPKLAALGLVSEEREETGRRRKTYSITNAGMVVVREWLATPPTREPSYDDEAIMKLTYAALGTPDAVRDLARDQVAYYTWRIEAFEAGLLVSDEDAERRRYIRTGARLALRQAHTLLEFWRDVEKDPDRRSEVKRRGV
jgi:PadR family transcriptional regulator AphA